MGSLCSKSDSLSGGHRVLGSVDGTGSSSGPRPPPRSAAAEAAEARLKSVRQFFIFLNGPFNVFRHNLEEQMRVILTEASWLPKSKRPNPRNTV